MDASHPLVMPPFRLSRYKLEVPTAIRACRRTTDGRSSPEAPGQARPRHHPARSAPRPESGCGAARRSLDSAAGTRCRTRPAPRPRCRTPSRSGSQSWRVSARPRHSRGLVRAAVGPWGLKVGWGSASDVSSVQKAPQKRSENRSACRIPRTKCVAPRFHQSHRSGLFASFYYTLRTIISRKIGGRFGGRSAATKNPKIMLNIFTRFAYL